MKNKDTSKKRLFLSGFTLIEVLIALSVIAIGLTAVLKTSFQAVSNAQVIQNKIFALWVLENKAAEIRLNSNTLPTGSDEGQQQQGRQTWLWQTDTATTPNPKIKKVTLIISVPETDQENILEQSIYLRTGK